MMTRDQREAAYAAVGVLRRTGNHGHADAVSQALADLYDYQVMPQPLMEWTQRAASMASEVGPGVLAVGSDGVVLGAPTEETYVYWVVYAYRELTAGQQSLAACRVPRSSPILSCDDRMQVARKIASDTGRNVVLISAELTREGVEL